MEKGDMYCMKDTWQKILFNLLDAYSDYKQTSERPRRSAWVRPQDSALH